MMNGYYNFRTLGNEKQIFFFYCIVIIRERINGRRRRDLDRSASFPKAQQTDQWSNVGAAMDALALVRNKPPKLWSKLTQPFHFWLPISISFSFLQSLGVQWRLLVILKVIFKRELVKTRNRNATNWRGWTQR